MKKPVVLSLFAVSALALAGCSTAAADSTSDDGLVSVVASTNVYGDIAATIGGDLVSVTSIIDSAAQDPHSYEASAQDQLAISNADLVIQNGGGYDPFIESLVDASGTEAALFTAVDASGLLDENHDDEHAHDDAAAEEEHTEEEHAEEEGHEGHDHIEGFNEHIWYDLHSIEHVAHELAHELGEIDADNAATYESNYEAFAAELETLEAQAATIAERAAGQAVAVTEPVPVYLLEAAGFVNETPEDFTEAIEEGNDVSPAALQATLDLLAGGSVGLLAYNEQTASPETERVRAAAEDADLPVVSFAETLPEGSDYVAWMTSNLDAISAALPE